MNCLPDLPPTFKKCTFDICWHFAVSMNYKLKISAGKVFRSNLRNVFLLSKKKAINYNVHFFIHLFANLCRKFSVKFRSIIFVIDLQWKAKQGFFASQRAPTLKPWAATSFARYLYFLIHKNCLIAECQPSSSYRACNCRLFRAFAVNIAVFSRNQAGAKNRNRFKEKLRRNTTHSLFWECEIQLQNFTYLKFALVVVWFKMVVTGHKTVLGIR